MKFLFRDIRRTVEHVFSWEDSPVVLDLIRDETSSNGIIFEVHIHAAPCARGIHLRRDVAGACLLFFWSVDLQRNFSGEHVVRQRNDVHIGVRLLCNRLQFCLTCQEWQSRVIHLSNPLVMNNAFATIPPVCIRASLVSLVKAELLLFNIYYPKSIGFVRYRFV